MITDNNGRIFEDRRKTNIPVAIERRAKVKAKEGKNQIKENAKQKELSC